MKNEQHIIVDEREIFDMKVEKYDETYTVIHSDKQN